MTGEDEIVIQGDVTDDVIDFIQEKWPEVNYHFFVYTATKYDIFAHAGRRRVD